MTKTPISLNGGELAGYIKQRHTQTLRGVPNIVLAIVKNSDDLSVDRYIRVKNAYAQDIGAKVQNINANESSLKAVIEELNTDDAITGYIVQLPFSGVDDIDSLLTKINPLKDVDNLSGLSPYDSPTATAILWLLAGYNIDLASKKIVIVGNGRLVGKPIADLLSKSGHTPTVIDENSNNYSESIKSADILITGAGKPQIIKSEWIAPGTVVVDAGVASEKGELKGDVEDTARKRADISITPLIGGVGPLTVCALFDNLLRANSSR